MGCRNPQLPVGSAAGNKTGWSFNLTQAYRHSDSVYQDRNDIGGGMSTTVHQSLATLHWQATPKFGLGLTIPYFEKLERTEDGDDTVNLQGLGDIRLMATFKPAPKATGWLQNLTLLAGLELPTGADDNITANDRQGFALFEGVSTNSQFQLGTGTWDPVVGYQVSFPVNDAWSIYHESLAQFSLGTSSKGLNPGNFVTTEVGVRWKTTEKLRLSAGVEAAFRSEDELSGETILNSGGVVLSAALQASYQVTNKWELQAGVRAPFYLDLKSSQFSAETQAEFGVSRSGQLAPGPFIFAGVTYRF
jgi:hypothetical protein